MAHVKRLIPWLHGVLALLVWSAGRAIAPRGRSAAPVRGRACVIQLNAIGDVLMTTPLLRALVDFFGPGQVDVVVQERMAPLLSGVPGLGSLLFAHGLLGWRSPGSLWRFWQLVRQLRSRRYGVMLDATRLLQSAWLTFLARPGRGVGAAVARRLGPFVLPRLEYLYSDEVPLEPRMHMIRQHLALLKPLGIPPAAERMTMVPAAGDVERSAAWLIRHGFPPGVPFAVIHPGAKWPPRRWPAERFREIARRLPSVGLRVICIGNREDRSLLRTLSQGVFPAPTIMGDELPLGAVAALIQRASLFVGNDSGPMHLAEAVGTPVIALFGPTHPDAVGPLGAGGRAVVKPIECRPCRLYYTRDACERGHTACLDVIQVEQVWRAIQDLLAEHASISEREMRRDPDPLPAQPDRAERR